MLSPQRAAPQISTIRQPDTKQLQQQQQQQHLQQQARQRNLRANLSPSPLKTPAINFQPRNQKAPKQVLVPASLANFNKIKLKTELHNNNNNNYNNKINFN
ncbi:hypothetical protein PPERSA_09978 [Pseudocohnilembus persalinus]|uniref:Uncharacterized protein n=1 Tax=Pseudocohnilembus persalinus TaxID=266149 RepID=A0A0V0QJD3_PSEPJ|nr:hypothetical protein PPERSA_09978 [Pseudocohnilembus persalinus]|eukprot:KRX02361.1 hypothetical protein PPERSA_09978 [Pseudocohnilembus persalinus]